MNRPFNDDKALNERLEADVALKRYRQMVEQTPVAMLVVKGPELVFETINQAMLTLLDRGPDMLGKSAIDAIPELAGQPVLETLQQVYQTGQSYNGRAVEIPLNRMGKLEMGYFDLTYTPYYEGNTITGVMQIATEVTDQVKAIKKLEASEERFRNLIEEAPVASCLFTGRNMKIEVANDVILGYWGKDKSVIGKLHEEALPELKGQPFGEILEEVFMTGKTYQAKATRADLEVNGKLGTYYFDFTYKPLRNAAGEVDSILAMSIDVTEQVVARQKQEESKNLLEFAIDATELGTWDLNPVTNRFIANARLKEWFGVPPEEEVELSLATRVIAEKDRQRVTNAIQQALQYSSGGLYDIDYTLVHPITRQERIVRAKGKAWFTEEQIAYRFNGTLQDITERQKAEIEKQKLISIMDTSHEFIGLANLDMSIQYANPAALAMLGWDTIGGKRILDCIYPEDRAFAETIVSQLPEQGHFSHEIRFMNARTGQPFWLQWNAVTLKDALSNEIIGLATVSPNITERKNVEQSLAESEQKLRSVVESAPFPIGVYVGREMRIQLANKSIIEVWGKGNDVIGKLYAEILPELASQSIYAQLDSVYTTGVPFHTKNQRVDIMVEGRLQPYYFNYSFTPLYNASGQVYGVMNTAAEVTDLVLAKQQVEDAEAALRGAIELAELATWSLDITTNTFHYSVRFMEWLGFSEDTKSLDEAYNPIPDDYRQSVADAIAAVCQPDSSGLYQNEHPIINRLTGQVRIIHAQAQVFYDAEGKPVVLRGTAQDITKQRNVQLALEQQVQERIEEMAVTNEELAAINEEYEATNEELAESNQLLTRSNENLQRFAYVASHDLQEPLRKVQQFSDLLKNRYADQLGEGVDYLDRMQSAASRMSTLIRDLLSFSRISTQRDTSALVSLTEVIHTVLTDLDLRIQETGAVIEAEPLPVIQGDKSQLGQLFQNLISNALKFRRADTTPMIQVQYQTIAAIDLPPSVKPTRLATAYYRISVADNGIGFDEKYVDRIFQVFQRLHGRHQYTGTGIGLAICEKVVTNHGGAITASSQPGQGATFSVYLPVTVVMA